MYYVELKISPALKKNTFPNSRPTSDIQYGYIQEREHTWSNDDDAEMPMMLIMLMMLMMLIMLMVLMVILVTPRMSRLWWRRKGSQGSSSITASSGRRKDSQHRWRFSSPSSSGFNRPKICEHSIWCKKFRIGSRVAYEILVRPDHKIHGHHHHNNDH